MIFISYSSTDNKIAENVCDSLEKKALSCWLAPRDIKPSESYPDAIMRGIENAKLMIIIVSDDANLSRHVLNEVEQAFKLEIPIIPLRIQNIELSRGLNYFLSRNQWVDALSGDMTANIDDLANQIMDLLEITDVQKPKLKDPKPVTRFSKKIMVALSLVVAIGFGAFHFINKPLDLNEVLVSYPAAMELANAVPNDKIKITAKINSDKSQFTKGDIIVLSVATDKPSWIVVIAHFNDKSKLLLYPNDHSGIRKLNANEAILLGAEGGGFNFEIDEPYGVDLVQIVASQRKEELIKLFEESQPISGAKIKEVSIKALSKSIERISNRGIKINKETELKGEAWGNAFVIVKSGEK